MMQYTNEAELRHKLTPDEAQRISEAKRLLRRSEDYAQVAETFRALGDRSRAKIVDALLHQELCTSDLAEVTKLSEPAVSQHLRLLKMLRIVTGHRHGQRVFYTLSDDHVRSLMTLALAHLYEDAGGMQTEL